MTTSPDTAAIERDPGAYDIRSALETITLLCEENGEPCDGFRFRELILKARTFLSTAPTTGSAPESDIETMRVAFERATPAVAKFHYKWDASKQRYLQYGDEERGQYMQNDFADWCTAWRAALDSIAAPPANAPAASMLTDEQLKAFNAAITVLDLNGLHGEALELVNLRALLAASMGGDRTSRPPA